MRSYFSLAIILFSFCLFSCSSISQEDCKKDMKSFGIEIGRKGLPDQSDDIRKACISSNTTVDLEAYTAGFNTGWSEYCTPLHGFENGQKLDTYKSFCPPLKETLYHEKFLIGKNLADKRDQLDDFEDKLKRSPTDKELKDFVLQLKREIQILEQKGANPSHTD